MGEVRADFARMRGRYNPSSSSDLARLSVSIINHQASPFSGSVSNTPSIMRSARSKLPDDSSSSARFGQTSLVCVEDIARESEYKSALLYASPTQKVELERERDTVSENAAQFLLCKRIAFG